MPERPMSVSDAAASGDRRRLLEALQATIAQAVDDPTTPARDLAALARRLDLISADIEAIDARAAEEGDDDAASVPDEPFDPASI